MNCTIRGLSQRMDFARDTMQTFLLIELPTGEVISALIEEDVAARVIASRVGPSQGRGGSTVALFEEASDHTPAIPTVFPMDTLPPIAAQRDAEDVTTEPDRDEQESDEDGTPSV